jgi:hypothetical protein
MEDIMEKPIMTQREVAEYLKVDERIVDKCTKEGVMFRCKTPKLLYNRQQIEKLRRRFNTIFTIRA